MTNITFYIRPDHTIIGLKSKGHADFGSYGNDVVCSAVSILIINTINSIQKFTSDKGKERVDSKKATIHFEIQGNVSSEAQVLFQSLKFGLEEVAKEYPGNVSIEIRERS